MTTTVIVGGFFGDEGKGKIVSYLSLEKKIAASVRGGVGPNAGHTVFHRGEEFKLRMLPSGILNKSSKLMVGPGVLIDPNVLLNEIEKYDLATRVVIDPMCAIIKKEHLLKDRVGYLKDELGTTGTGTGPANSDRILRKVILSKDCEIISSFLGDVPGQLNQLIDDGKDVLVEGTQGTFLSLFFGTYPYVTSKDVCASAICSDVGIGPKKVDEVILVFKSYVTRVGKGPLDNELSIEDTTKLGWQEKGTVTGRLRRAAPFNYDLAKRSVMLNGASNIALTKLDVVFPECAGVREYDKVSKEGKRFIKKIEEYTGVNITLIGTGPDVFDIVDRRQE